MAQDDYIRTALRVPPALHKALHEAAETAGHSFNAEILRRLSSTFEVEPVDARQIEIADQLRRMELLQNRDSLRRDIEMMRNRLDMLWVRRHILQRDEASVKRLTEAAQETAKLQAQIEWQLQELERAERNLIEFGEPGPAAPP